MASQIKIDISKLSFKRSGVVLFFKVFAVEFIFTVLNILVNVVDETIAEYTFTEKKIIFTDVTISLILFAIHAVIIGYIIVKWVSETYEVNDEELIINSGLLSRKSEVYPLRNLESMTAYRGVLGQIFNYGSVEMKFPLMNKTVWIMDIPYPDQFVPLIDKYASKSTKKDITIINNSGKK